jgi:DNA-binding transcriptional LysR family regulator
VRSYDFANIHDCLIDAEVDLAFLYLPYDDDELAALEVVPLLQEPRTVVMASSHPLANRGEVTPADVANEVFITHSPAVSQTWRDFWLLAEELGHRPAVHPRVADTLEEWLHQIKQGNGIDTCPSLISRYYPWPGITFVPLVAAQPATLALVRRRDAHEPLVDAFVAAALDVAARELAGERPTATARTAA